MELSQTIIWLSRMATERMHECIAVGGLNVSVGPSVVTLGINLQSLGLDLLMWLTRKTLFLCLITLHWSSSTNMHSQCSPSSACDFLQTSSLPSFLTRNFSKHIVTQSMNLSC